MANKPNSTADLDQSNIYQIRIQGHLDHQWSDWFDDLTIMLDEDGTTLLTGPVVDDAALHGLLKKVRDAGLRLLSVNQIEADQAGEVDRAGVGDASSEKVDGPRK
jgi:hypothetical protein